MLRGEGLSYRLSEGGARGAIDVREGGWTAVRHMALGSLVHNKATDTWLAARDGELWKLKGVLTLELKLFTSFKQICYTMPMALKSTVEDPTGFASIDI
jgi:hypothetical protein